MNAGPARHTFGPAGVRRPDGGAQYAVICTVEGGRACRLVQGRWDDPKLDALARLLIDDLGYKTVEHAPHRQAVVRWTPGSPLVGGRPGRGLHEAEPVDAEDG